MHRHSDWMRLKHRFQFNHILKQQISFNMETVLGGGFCKACKATRFGRRTCFN